MTVFEFNLYDFLTNASLWPNLVALVDDRVFPVVLPQGAEFPAITYSRINSDVKHSQDGYTGLTIATFQISCWSTDYSECKNVAREVKKTTGFRGQVGSNFVGAVHWIDETDMYEEQSLYFHVALDFSISYCETP